MSIDELINDPELLDEGLLPFIKGLNELGMETYASCRGHYLGERPYIGFKLRKRDIKRILETINERNSKKLDMSIEFKGCIKEIYGFESDNFLIRIEKKTDYYDVIFEGLPIKDNLSKTIQEPETVFQEFYKNVMGITKDYLFRLETNKSI